MQMLYRAEVKVFFCVYAAETASSEGRICGNYITSVCDVRFKTSRGKRKREFLKGVMFRTWKPCAPAEVQCC